LLHDMGQSLAHLLVHAIFSTKDRRPSLHSEEIRNEKTSKLQARAGTPAPQCGTGVLARQIAESGLEIVQTPDRR